MERGFYNGVFMGHRGEDVIVIVDAQNSFCKESGIIFDQHSEETKIGIAEAIRNMDLFLRSRRVQDAIRIYLCSNKYFSGRRWEFQNALIVELQKLKQKHIFWRDSPRDDPFVPELITFLERHSRPIFLLCGFNAHQCVAHTALCALQRRLPVIFIKDCMYPFFEDALQGWFLEELASTLAVDKTLVSFLSSQEYLRTKEAALW